nr:Sorting nexin mvp1 like [Ipomoea batatas]
MPAITFETSPFTHKVLNYFIESATFVVEGIMQPIVGRQEEHKTPEPCGQIIVSIIPFPSSVHLKNSEFSTKRTQMETTSSSHGLQFHGRSISLPSRLYPTPENIEAELNKLRTWETTTSSSPPSSKSIRARLLMVSELYESLQELVQSPSTQRALLQQNRAIVEEALEGSLVFLDLCGNIQGVIHMVKDKVKELQSALRRKGGDSSIEGDITDFLSFIKRVKKEATKSLRKLKQMENTPPVFHEIDVYSSMVIRVMREVSAITILALRPVLAFLSCPALKNNKSSGWALISRLVLNKSAIPSHETIGDNLGSVDAVLASLQGIIKINGDLQMARKRLQNLDAEIEGLETGLDCLYRHLIQSRVSLLNILTC